MKQQLALAELEGAAPDGGPPLDAALEAAMCAGQIMLENGAGTARVEETVVRMGMALGAERVEVFATPTGLFAMHTAGGRHTTRVQRVQRSDIDLSKIEGALEVSRMAVAGAVGPREAGAALARVAAAPRPFGLGATVAASALCCGASAGLLGGGAREVLTTAAAAAAGQVGAELIGRLGLNRMIATAAAAALATGLALALALVFGANAPLAMLSSILMLTPGVLIVSAVSDLFRGDTLAGLARAAMALLSVAAIASGVWLVLAAGGVAIRLGAAPAPGWPLALALACLTTIGFAMLFGVPPRRLPAGALAGTLAYAAFRAASELGAPPALATLAGSLAAAVLAELLARLLRAPSLLFTTPGIITLVPGAIAFRTMLSFAGGDLAAAGPGLVETALLAFALAAGLGLVTSVSAARPPSRRG